MRRDEAWTAVVVVMMMMFINIGRLGPEGFSCLSVGLILRV
jgi:hypothetical protein